jgi:hypothetical protein
MARYGINYYGLSTYGTETAVAYAANNFTATSGAVNDLGTQYGAITLNWNSPSGNWSKIKLVRNSYGFPVNEVDGTQLDLKNNNMFEAYKETDPTTFIDKNLAKNAFYYYSLFVFERVNYKWLRAGNAIGLAVEDYGYADNLYNFLPEIYKIANLNEVAGESSNQTLYNFLSIFGFELSKYHTLTNLLINRHDTSKLNGLLLPSLLQQFGLQYEPEIGYQHARILARDAGQLYKSKGTVDGLREFLKAFTGWAVPTVASVPNPTVNGISVSKNLMLDYNDSSFEESVGHWASSGSANLYCLKAKEVKTIALTSNVATLDIGAHQYNVGNYIFVSGSALPLFNQATAVAITAVTTTTISFSLTGSNVTSMNAWNASTESYPQVSPSPAPWDEPTTPIFYPNKQLGIMAVKNSSVTAGTVTLDCGSTAPIIKGIPVTAGTAYSFSVYTVNSTTTRNVTVGITWYDRLGASISSVTGSATASGTGAFSARATVVNKTAPSTAYYAVPTISIAALAGSASNEYQYFDCAQWEASASATAFDEARQLNLTLKATRINELLNPHFELSGGSYSSPTVAPWVISGSAATVTISETAKQPETTSWQTLYKTLTSGVARIETLYTNDFKVGNKVYVSGVGTSFDGVQTVTAVGASASSGGTVTTYSYIEYSVSGSPSDVVRTADDDGVVWLSGNVLKLAATAAGTVNVKSWDSSTSSHLMPIHYPDTSYTFSVYTQRDTSNESVTVSIKWYTSAATPVLISTSTSNAFTITASGNDWNRPYITAVAPTTAAYAVVSLDWQAANGRTLWLDSALFENSPIVSWYFDGASGYGSFPDYEWQGTANGSRSHYYKNKFAIQDRTSNAMFKDKLPLGSTVAIYLAQPKT